MKATTLTAFATAMLLSVASFADTADARERGARGDGAKVAKGARTGKARGQRRAVRRKTTTTVRANKPETSRAERTVRRVLRAVRPLVAPVARRGRVATPGIDARIRRLDRRVVRGRYQGALPRNFARRMMTRLDDVRAQRRIARRDGVVTQRERRQMRRVLNRVNNRLSQFGA
jgi:hypothetical protein